MISDEFVKTAKESIGTKRGQMLASLQQKYLNQGYSPKEANQLAIEEYNQTLQKIKQEGIMPEEEWLNTAQPLAPAPGEVARYATKDLKYPKGTFSPLKGFLGGSAAGAATGLVASQVNTNIPKSQGIPMGALLGGLAGGLGGLIGRNVNDIKTYNKAKKLTPAEREMIMHLPPQGAYDYIHNK